jgi:site-specific DNA-methyltransferase (adenine-specific)
MSDEDFYNFLSKAFKNIYDNLKPGGVYYIWYASKEVVNFSNALEDNSLPVRQELIWNKNSLVMGRQDYQWKHEPCLYGWKEGAGHYFIDDRTQTTVIEDKKPDIKKLKKEEMMKIKGGAGISSAMLNALMRAVSVMFSIGQAVGSAIRRTSSKNYC